MKSYYNFEEPLKFESETHKFLLYQLRISDRQTSKYMALVRDLNDNTMKLKYFGARSYPQYKDSTPIKAYSDMDHLDEKRKRNFYSRHNRNTGISATLSKYFLW